MYRTIVQNKIISIICSCLLYFCMANNYRPSLGKVRLGRANPTPNFYLRRKKKRSTQNCAHYNAVLPNFQF